MIKTNPLTGRTLERQREVERIVEQERRRLDRLHGFGYQPVEVDPQPCYARDRLKGAQGD